MIVSLGSIDVTDELRRAIRARIGRSGLATRAEVRSMVSAEMDAFLQTVLAENTPPEPESPEAT